MKSSSMLDFVIVVVLILFVFGMIFQMYLLSGSIYNTKNVNCLTNNDRTLRTSVVNPIVTKTESISNRNKNGFYPNEFGFGGEKSVPKLVQAWRQAKVDWHELV